MTSIRTYVANTVLLFSMLLYGCSLPARQADTTPTPKSITTEAVTQATEELSDLVATPSATPAVSNWYMVSQNIYKDSAGKPLDGVLIVKWKDLEAIDGECTGRVNGWESVIPYKNGYPNAIQSRTFGQHKAAYLPNGTKIEIGEQCVFEANNGGTEMKGDIYASLVGLYGVNRTSLILFKEPLEYAVQLGGSSSGSYVKQIPVPAP